MSKAPAFKPIDPLWKWERRRVSISVWPNKHRKFGISTYGLHTWLCRRDIVIWLGSCYVVLNWTRDWRTDMAGYLIDRRPPPS